MNEREKLLKRLQVCDFVLNETALFLNTHPDDKAALEYYKKYMEMERESRAEYVKKYGPVSRTEYDGGPRWNWIDNPWPWEEV